MGIRRAFGSTWCICRGGQHKIVSVTEVYGGVRVPTAFSRLCRTLPLIFLLLLSFSLSSSVFHKRICVSAVWFVQAVQVRETSRFEGYLHSLFWLVFVVLHSSLQIVLLFCLYL